MQLLILRSIVVRAYQVCDRLESENIKCRLYRQHLTAGRLDEP